jgi:peptide/nickel transport system ATP-binding protein
MVFQDPYGSLSPVYRVSHGIMRALKLHRRDLSRRGMSEEAERLLDAVGLVPAGDFLAKFPYQLSGGQRQRIGFAQALACRPELILADEPVSMLDVSVRIGVLNLLASLRRRQRISFLYITHDIASARYIADRLVVLYAGQVAETGPVEDVLAHPKHPYTQLLLSAVPDPRAPMAVAATDQVQEPPRVIDPGEGCRFRSRCPYAVDECFRVTPRLRPLRPAHEAACHVATPDLAGDQVEDVSLR